MTSCWISPLKFYLFEKVSTCQISNWSNFCIIVLFSNPKPRLEPTDHPNFSVRTSNHHQAGPQNLTHPSKGSVPNARPPPGQTLTEFHSFPRYRSSSPLGFIVNSQFQHQKLVEKRVIIHPHLDILMTSFADLFLSW